MKPTLKVTKDFTQEFNDIVAQFKHDEVLVGIPAEKADRKDDQEINNATILAINEFGSPAMNIPPRPVMSIGIDMAQDQISDLFGKAVVEALTKGSQAAETYYDRAGIAASQSIKKVINEQIGIEGPSEATLRIRESRGFKGTKSLIVTGQMRNAITWVRKNDRG